MHNILKLNQKILRDSNVISFVARVYAFVLFIYWAERMISAIGAALVGTPLLIVLYKTRIEIGPWST